jgi:hypothetical protein
MRQRPRIYYSESQKALMWERWRKGDTLHQIAQLFIVTTRRCREFCCRLEASNRRRVAGPDWR